MSAKKTLLKALGNMQMLLYQKIKIWGEKFLSLFDSYNKKPWRRQYYRIKRWWRIYFLITLLVLCALIYMFFDSIVSIFPIFWDWLHAVEVLDYSDEVWEYEMKNRLENPAWHEAAANVAKNRGWIIWGMATFFIAILGIALTTWGRILAHKSNSQEKKKIELSKDANIHERYYNATHMLRDEVLHVRIAGCRMLKNLVMFNEEMASLCTGLLFGFIKSPFLSEEEKNTLGKEPYNLIKIFPKEKELRPDIQEAINSVSDICLYANWGGESIGIDKIIQLPSYFWQNKNKGRLELIDTNFTGQDMQKAELQDVDFSNADLQNVNLSKANLKGVIFADADLTGANLKGVKNLTKKQILQAYWDINGRAEGVPPKLTSELMKDKAIQKWCKKPRHDYSEDSI